MEAWQSKLAQGDAQAAWTLFAERYGRLILATIRRLVSDHDDVMDVYSAVCDSLSADDCARLRRHSVDAERAASMSTWLVVVVRNRTVDWLRQRDGRRRATVPDNLSPLQQAIHRAICGEGDSQVAAYEHVQEQLSITLSFAAFLREVRVTQNLAPCAQARPLSQPTPASVLEQITAPEEDASESEERARRIAAAMSSQPADVRVAVEMFIVDGVGAADVARAVGWPNAKAVYNRVHRALEALRTELLREGIGPRDL